MNCNWLGRWGNTNSWIRTFLFLCTTIKAKSHLCTKTWNLVLQKHKCVHSQQHSVTRLSLIPRGQILPMGPPAVLIWWSTPGIPPAPSSDSHTAAKQVLLGPSMGLCLQCPPALKSSTIAPEIPSSGERHLPLVDPCGTGAGHSYRTGTELRHHDHQVKPWGFDRTGGIWFRW